MIVLDASAAVHMVRESQEGHALLALLDDIEGESIISCSMFGAEVRNAFWKYVKAGQISYGVACDCIEDAIGLVDDFVSIEDLADEAFLEAVNRQHSVYDMLYLCLARRKGATLFTLDRRLASLCQKMNVNCASLSAL